RVRAGGCWGGRAADVRPIGREGGVAASVRAVGSEVGRATADRYGVVPLTDVRAALPDKRRYWLIRVLARTLRRVGGRRGLGKKQDDAGENGAGGRDRDAPLQKRAGGRGGRAAVGGAIAPPIVDGTPFHG